MEYGRSWHRYRVAFVMAVSLLGLPACGSESGAELDTDEPLARAEQPIIPGSDVVQVASTFFLPPGGTVTNAEARCPAGSDLVGGGYFVGAAAADVRVHASYGSGSSWRISVINLSNTVGTSMDVYAQCLRGTNAGSFVQWSSNVSLGAGAVATQIVQCPTGAILAGGGFEGTSEIHGTRNNPERVTSETVGWAFSAKNLNIFGSTTFRVQAVCLNGVRGGTTVRNKATSVPAGGQLKFSSDACPAETLLSSGGIYFSSGSPSVVKGNLRNFQNPSLWTSVVVNKEPTSTSVSMTVACLHLWPL